MSELTHLTANDWKQVPIEKIKKLFVKMPSVVTSLLIQKAR